MDFHVELLSRIDVPTIIAMASMFYFMNSRFDKKFDKIENKIDKLDEKLTDVDRRLCRLEGAFASKDCYMIEDSNQMKKVK